MSCESVRRDRIIIIRAVTSVPPPYDEWITTSIGLSHTGGSFFLSPCEAANAVDDNAKVAQTARVVFLRVFIGIILFPFIIDLSSN